MIGPVEVVDPRGEPGWDAAVAGSSTELFLSRPWLETIGDVFDLKVQASVQRDATGAIVGLLPFCPVDDARGPRVSIVPFSDYVMPVLSSAAQWSALVAPVLDLGVTVGLAGTADSPARSDPRFATETVAVRQSIPLDGSPTDLVARCSPHHRRLVRKAERAGLRFRLATSTDELRTFYELHLGVRRDRYRMLAQPYRLFEQLWERFVVAGNGALVVGMDGDTMAAGCLLLQAGDTFYYKYAASHPAYRSVGASHGTVAAAMAVGVERRLSSLDLGRTDLDQPGLVDFKRRFAANSEGLCRSTSAEPDTEPPAIDATLAELTELLTAPDVPRRVTERAGTTLYRLFA